MIPDDQELRFRLPEVQKIALETMQFTFRNMIGQHELERANVTTDIDHWTRSLRLQIRMFLAGREVMNTVEESVGIPTGPLVTLHQKLNRFFNTGRAWMPRWLRKRMIPWFTYVERTVRTRHVHVCPHDILGPRNCHAAWLVLKAEKDFEYRVQAANHRLVARVLELAARFRDPRNFAGHAAGERLIQELLLAVDLHHSTCAAVAQPESP